MIRKWLKLNRSFVRLLVNSAASKNQELKWPLDQPDRNRSCCSLSAGSPDRFLSALSGPNDRGDGLFRDEDAVAETLARTELFEVKGPQGAAFLIEVRSEDLEEVRRDLVRLKGDIFHFDSAIIGLFTMKCLLTAEPLEQGPDRLRLAKVHAISSGCEEVVEIDSARRFLFVNAIDKTLRAKKMLERFGYKITGILYRFQPKEKINLSERFREVCQEFVGAVQQLPKVISVIHNLG